MKRNQSIVRKAKIRDKACVKCGKTTSLEAHHIVALCEGGKDELENLATLCSICHHEWEYIARALKDMTFQEWIDIPQSGLLIQMWRIAPEDTTFRDIKQIVAAMVDTMKVVRSEEID